MENDSICFHLVLRDLDLLPGLAVIARRRHLLEVSIHLNSPGFIVVLLVLAGTRAKVNQVA